MTVNGERDTVIEMTVIQGVEVQDLDSRSEMSSEVGRVLEIGTLSGTSGRVMAEVMSTRAVAVMATMPEVTLTIGINTAMMMVIAIVQTMNDLVAVQVSVELLRKVLEVTVSVMRILEASMTVVVERVMLVTEKGLVVAEVSLAVEMSLLEAGRNMGVV